MLEQVTFMGREFHVTSGNGYIGLINLGIKAISEIPGLSSLQTVNVLNLGGNQITNVRSSDFSGGLLGLRFLILDCNPVRHLESLVHLTQLENFILREYDLPETFDFKAVLPESVNFGDTRKHPYMEGRVGTIAEITERFGEFHDTSFFTFDDIADDFTEEETEIL